MLYIPINLRRYYITLRHVLRVLVKQNTYFSFLHVTENALMTLPKLILFTIVIVRYINLCLLMNDESIVASVLIVRILFTYLKIHTHI